MAAAEPAPVVPPTAIKNQGTDEQVHWPPPDQQLEKWMMNTVKEGDSAARFLRTMLQMNPAYGTYLQTDEDLIEVVQMFSKRIKTKVAQFETPSSIPSHVLTQPLCELVWRVVGFVMHNVIELEEEANMPVPKEASGMIRMLLHTNTQLSNKLNELRRVYLKELAEHRDRQRRISKTAERAIAHLQEQPIMFFEPLEFVLDETTKDFVREAVVERMKLEMRTTAMNSDENAEMTHYIEELEEQVDLLKAEVKTCRATSNRLEEQMKGVALREEKLREDLKGQRQGNEDKAKQITELEAQVKQLTSDNSKKDRRIEHLEQKLADGASNSKGTSVEVPVDDHLEDMEALSQRNIELESENKRQASLIQQLQKELDEVREILAAGGNEERVVYKDDAEMKRLLEQALQVERELRAANEALEKALTECENEAAELRDKLGLATAARKERPTEKKTREGPSADELDEMQKAALDKAMKKARKEFEGKINSMQDQIEKLTDKLEKANARIEELEDELTSNGKQPKQKVVKQIGIPEEEHTKLKVRCHELETQLENMEDEYAKLEQKVAMLMDKLKEKFSDQELGEILTKIELAPPPIRKKRKKKAYERLYDDAQRRILELKMRQAKLRELEERSLRNMARIVASSKDKRKVEMLGHLQTAKQQTSQRFHDALINFQKARSRTGELSGLEGDDETEFEEDMKRIDRLTDLEELTINCFKDGVCPRCAFSALATFRRASKSIVAAAPSSLASQAYQGPPRQSVGTNWHMDDASSQGGSLGMPQMRPRSRTPPPWEMGVVGYPHIQDTRPESTSSSPHHSPMGHLSNPLGPGARPGAMPFDAAFPMSTPPWRQNTPPTAPHSPPWQPDASASGGAGPSVASAGPPVARGREDVRKNPSSRGAGAPTAGTLPTSSSTATGFFGRDSTPPWRKARSNSPERGQVVPPPSGFAPPRQGGSSSSIGRLGRPPGQDLLPPPVPGRVPGPQTVALDPIVRPPDMSPQGRTLQGAGSSSSRSPSPDRAAGKKHASDGFRKMRTSPSDIGTQFEADLARPRTVPSPFGGKSTRSPRSFDGPGQSATGEPGASLGGGGRGTQYMNINSSQPPSVPSSRSMPSLPVAGSQVRAPWQGAEVPWESPASAKRLAPKAPLRKPGPGFVVKPLVSQERLSASSNSGAPPL